MINDAKKGKKSSATTQSAAVTGEVAKKTVRRRLFVGEGDFSFTQSYIARHPGRAKYIVATEFDKEVSEEIKARLDDLIEKGVSIQLGVDCTQLNLQLSVLIKKFRRIHFNFPWAYNPDTESRRANYKTDDCNQQLIEGFFQSAKTLQEVGDRIHVTLKKTYMGLEFIRLHVSCLTFLKQLVKLVISYIKSISLVRVVIQGTNINKQEGVARLT